MRSYPSCACALTLLLLVLGCIELRAGDEVGGVRVFESPTTGSERVLHIYRSTRPENETSD